MLTSLSSITLAMQIECTIQIWKEGEMYVAYAPQLDISSCGKTPEEAKKNIQEATELFLDEVKKTGNLKQILEESGFSFKKSWKAPEILSLEKINVTI